MDFPNVRKEYTGVGNPLFITDIVNLTDSVLIAMKNVLGLGDTDFAIISGFDYTPGAPGSYAVGICYMNGVFYKSTATLAEGKYLQPDPTDYLSKAFPDSISRYCYTINYCIVSNTSVGGMPQFSGNMNGYRVNVKKVMDSLVDYAKPIDSGDPAAADYSTFDFTRDGNIHSLDISSKIPVTAKYVLLRVVLTPSTVNDYIQFFKYGNTNPYNVSWVTAQSNATGTVYKDCWIAVDSNRKLGYKGYAGTIFSVTIAGYM